MHKFILPILLLLCTSIFADVNVSVTLSELKVEKSQEENGDEIYFSVIEYGKKSSDMKRIPPFPQYWSEPIYHKVKNSKLWTKSLKNNDAYSVIISLIEHDMPPWNVDDHLGSVKLIVANKSDNLSISWSIPEMVDQKKITRVSEKTHEYFFQSEKSKYLVKFNLELDQ